MVFGAFVGMARHKHGIPYPTMYAVPGTARYYNDEMKPQQKTEQEEKKDNEEKADLITNSEAYAFNLVQRGHQNTIENAPFFLAILIAAWPYPLAAGIAGLIYLVGRALYMYGYMQNVKSRIYGAICIYPALLTLFVLSIMSMANIANGVEPY